jgi:DNA-binding SARP family transcriptional activator
MHIEASSVPLEIRLLGPLEVVRDGVAVVLAGRRERSVLALLASNAGDPVSVDRLFAFLWADDAPRTAGKTLQTYVSRLRRALGGDLLARREAGYALSVPRDAVDAVRFRDLLVQRRHLQQAGDDDRALAIYRRALDEWRGDQPAAAPDTPEAMAWRQGLVVGRLDALEATMALLVRGGRHQEAAAELEQLVVREPFRQAGEVPGDRDAERGHRELLDLRRSGGHPGGERVAGLRHRVVQLRGPEAGRRQRRWQQAGDPQPREPQGRVTRPRGGA